MTDVQAFVLLGLDPATATKKSIHTVWKRKVVENHRKGGNEKRWRDLNVARDTATAAVKLRDALAKTMQDMTEGIARAYDTAFDRFDRRRPSRDPNIERLATEIHGGVDIAGRAVLKTRELELHLGFNDQRWPKLMRLESEAKNDAQDYRWYPEQRTAIWARHLARMTEATGLIKEIDDERKARNRESARKRREKKKQG